MAPILLMVVVLYFLMIRPQVKRQKEHKSMADALKKGDEVITAGGIVGKITEINDQFVTLQVAAVNGQPGTDGSELCGPLSLTPALSCWERARLSDAAGCSEVIGAVARFLGFGAGAAFTGTASGSSSRVA